MVNNPLIKTLAGLSRKQVTRFKEFANSPYFNKHADVCNLTGYLTKNYPNFTEKKCHRETIFQALYPSHSHDQKKLAILFTYALRLLEQFLRVEEAVTNGMLQDNVLLSRQLKENEGFVNLKKMWEETFRGVNRKIRKLELGSPTFKTLETLKEMDDSFVRMSRYDDHLLNERQELMDVFYLVEKLKGACELVQRSKLLTKEFTPSRLFEESLTLLENKTLHYPAYPSVYIFSSLYHLLKTNNPSLYDQLPIDVAKYESILTKDELQMIFNALQNFCIGQINLGETVFLRKLFEIYQSQLNKKLLLVNKYLPEWHFKNMVTTALRLDEHEWVKDFITGYQAKLRPEVRENAFSYNLATYYYHLGRYEDVLKSLLQVEYTDLRYNLDAKSLLLRTYYDMEEEEAFMPLTDAFRQYLKRNKGLNEFQKQGYYNLIKFARNAFKLKMNKGFTSSAKWKSSLGKLKKELDAAEAVFNMGWLQIKINELSKI